MTQPEPGTVVVSEAGTGRYTQHVTAGGYEFVVDEPVSMGGDGSGPTPYDFLLGALGSCTAITLRMYADRKNIPLANVNIRLKHDRIHARDCERCDTEVGMVSRITREIELEGDLDDEQRAKLLAIADKCPVHRTLENQIDVQTKLV
ncbi:OsmC family protein [Amycolatopsis sp. FDAARGOS 1241]|uniref:OsmC family protein n=1 Tax=Amycolatopsis sp. FDAARGOS 1241 TaxID=2778070 RepID=UPI00194FFD96|nr:OsmC family protein [Amycolatopsis sp. FDAARGOS 1241]QRP48890.1 OsmC family protein [Amycolatopsis sp. FDAARGOS 1241]